jgi:hypothetical protein
MENKKELCVEILYVNLNAGMLYRTRVKEPKRLDSAIGKKVKIEVLELDCLNIDGSYYQIIGWYQGLAHIKPVDDIMEEYLEREEK